jgi:hypothetical protein
MRPTMSALPPAANGTISRTGLSGYPAANRGRDKKALPDMAARLLSNKRREIAIVIFCGSRMWSLAFGLSGGNSMMAIC